MNSLVLALILSIGGTLALKVVPVIFLKGDALPPIFKKWLDYVPVSVMAALVGPDIFAPAGSLNLSFNNLFLIASIPTALTAIIWKNYFLTIAVGIVFVIIARSWGFY